MKSIALRSLFCSLLVAVAVAAPASVEPVALAAEFDPSASDLDERAQLHCLALNVYHEARGEPDEGWFEVAMVTLNRVRSARYPDTPCRVVWQRKQFSWTADGKPDKPYNPQAWVKALWVATLAQWYDRFSPAEGATHFHAEYVAPSWARAATPLKRVGRHIFYRP